MCTLRAGIEGLHEVACEVTATCVCSVHDSACKCKEVTRSTIIQCVCIQVEGVAYRGRLYVEILSKPVDSSVELKPLQRINLTSIDRAMNMLQKENPKYKLFGIFFSAHMVNPHNDLVQFELSIG